MHRFILSLSLATFLAASPLAAQRAGRGQQTQFRSDLAAAVQNGNLGTDEKTRYDAALKTLDEQMAKRKAGERIDRDATRTAMRDLGQIARSENLKPEDREKLAKHAQQRGGKRRQ